MAQGERVEVKTKAAAEKAIKAGKPVRIVGGKFALAIAGLTGVDIQIAATAQIDVELTNVAAVVSQEDMWTSSVVAWGSSSVVARGYSTLQVHKPGVSAKASATVFVNLWHGATCDGGRQQEVSLATPLDWCEFYGARVEDGCAIVYKAVGEGYMSERGGGVCYAPGTMPSDPEWDGRKRECSRGGGLNFSPTPRHTHRFVPNPKHYLECRIRLDDDFAVHFDGQYPDKCCHRAVAAPLVEVEVDVDGNPIEQEAA